MDLLDVYNPWPSSAEALQDLSQAFEADTSSMSVPQWMDAATHLFNTNPSEFIRWEQENPVWGIRFHAQADKNRGARDYAQWNQHTGQEGLNHAERASGLAYMLTQQDPRYGVDGKDDGGSIAFNYNDWGDINSEDSTGDFFQIGQHASFTDDIWSQIEENPEVVAGLVSAVVAPWAAPAIAGATGLSTAAATGLLTGGSQALAGADWDESLLAGLGGYVAGGGLNDILSGLGIDPASTIGEGISGVAGSAVEALMPGGGGGGDSSGGGLSGLLPLLSGAAAGYLGSNGSDGGAGGPSAFNGEYRAPQRTGEVGYQPTDYGPLPQQRQLGQGGLLNRYALEDIARYAPQLIPPGSSVNQLQNIQQQGLLTPTYNQQGIL